MDRLENSMIGRRQNVNAVRLDMRLVRLRRRQRLGLAPSKARCYTRFGVFLPQPAADWFGNS